MGFRTLRHCVETLQREGDLVAVDHPVDPELEIAEIQRRLYRAIRLARAAVNRSRVLCSVTRQRLIFAVFSSAAAATLQRDGPTV